jgi:glycosyltransferase involved in cell wall biosynthesis
MERTTLVIPCYNEEHRLDPASIDLLLEDDGFDVLLVNDGSTDGTRDLLARLAKARADQIRVLELEQNSGKAEAVRRGLANVVEAGRAGIVGYFDADFATPAAEMRRLVRIMRGGDAQVLFGARVALLGHEIARSAKRHYLGRVFATLASMTLRQRVYDTQCGAKLFCVTPGLGEALREPFLSRWAFDVELLGRLLIGSATSSPIAPGSVWEEPLLAWRDVKGSKLDTRQMSRALVDLVRIERDLSRRRSIAASRIEPTHVPDITPVRAARNG